MRKFETKLIRGTHPSLNLPFVGVAETQCIEVPVPNVIPPTTPFQEAALLDPDLVECPSPVEMEVTYDEGDAVATPMPPNNAEFKRISVPLRTRHLLCAESKCYARRVTLISMGTALTINVAMTRGSEGVFPPNVLDSAFAVTETITVAAGDLPLPIIVSPGKEVWVYNPSAAQQDISCTIEYIAPEHSGVGSLAEKCHGTA